MKHFSNFSEVECDMDQTRLESIISGMPAW